MIADVEDFAKRKGRPVLRSGAQRCTVLSEKHVAQQFRIAERAIEQAGGFYVVVRNGLGSAAPQIR